MSSEPAIPGSKPAPSRRTAAPIELAPARSWRTMATIGVSMLLHDRTKLAGTLAGVVFAVMLANFQGSIFFGLLLKNTMFARRIGADLWITPPGTNVLIGGGEIPDTVVDEAREVPGVAWAKPLILQGTQIRLPSGGSSGLQLVGADVPADAFQGHYPGGPYHVVAGDPLNLRSPDSIFAEDSWREKLGGLNIGSVREVNHYRVTVVGFTSGLAPFGPPYTFTNFQTARGILHIANHICSYVMVGLMPSAKEDQVMADLRRRLPRQWVLSKRSVIDSTERDVLNNSGLGGMIGSGVAMSVITGFVIVALTMFSAVLDHVREFGTLKAIGARNSDLAKLLVTQAAFCALIGTTIGINLGQLMISMVAGAKAGPLYLPRAVYVGTFVGMFLMCSAASAFALMRVSKVEPAMVFRG